MYRSKVNIVNGSSVSLHPIICVRATGLRPVASLGLYSWSSFDKLLQMMNRSKSQSVGSLFCQHHHAGQRWDFKYSHRDAVLHINTRGLYCTAHLRLTTLNRAIKLRGAGPSNGVIGFQPGLMPRTLSRISETDQRKCVDPLSIYTATSARSKAKVKGSPVMQRLHVSISDVLALDFHVASKLSQETVEDTQVRPSTVGEHPIQDHTQHCGSGCS